MLELNKNDTERLLMIEEMIKNGKVYEEQKDKKENFYIGKLKRRECTKEKFMKAFNPKLSWKAIAKKLGISQQNCINFAKKYIGHGQDYRKPRVGLKATDDQIISAFEEYPNKKIATIARELNMNWNAVSKRAKKLNLIQ